jgi:formamidopyrimidine-DNA glycosylase
MPELPEVETISNQLNKTIKGKIIANIQILRSKSFQGDPKLILGKKVTRVFRHAKVINVAFQNEFPLTLIHLKMTGQLIYKDDNQRFVGGHPTQDWVNQLPGKHTRVIFTFKDHAKLFFNDLRVFGWVKVISNSLDLKKELKSFTGVEPLSSKFTLNKLKEIIDKINRPIKLLILDQQKIAGLGNIYANDALFGARIDPTRPAKSLSSPEIKALHQSIIKILKIAVKLGGTSQRDYRQINGSMGNYQDHFLVYKKEGEPCPICGSTIVKIKLGGRGTYYCPQCQK